MIVVFTNPLRMISILTGVVIAVFCIGCSEKDVALNGAREIAKSMDGLNGEFAEFNSTLKQLPDGFQKGFQRAADDAARKFNGTTQLGVDHFFANVRANVGGIRESLLDAMCRMQMEDFGSEAALWEYISSGMNYSPQHFLSPVVWSCPRKVDSGWVLATG